METFEVVGRTGKRWSAAKIRRVERQAELLGWAERQALKFWDIFVEWALSSRAYPTLVVVAFFAVMMGVVGGVDHLVDWVLGE